MLSSRASTDCSNFLEQFRDSFVVGFDLHTRSMSFPITCYCPQLTETASINVLEQVQVSFVVAIGCVGLYLASGP